MIKPKCFLFYENEEYVDGYKAICDKYYKFVFSDQVVLWQKTRRINRHEYNKTTPCYFYVTCAQFAWTRLIWYLMSPNKHHLIQVTVFFSWFTHNKTWGGNTWLTWYNSNLCLLRMRNRTQTWHIMLISFHVVLSFYFQNCNVLLPMAKWFNENNKYRQILNLKLACKCW